MKALVLGGSGLIGSKLVTALVNDGYAVSHTFNNNPIKLDKCESFKLDISDKVAVLDLFKKLNPELVIHTAALKGTDVCETNKELANEINIIGTQNVVNACKSIDSFIVYISSAFVFDGNKAVFTEEDTPNPINYYGKTKLEGEKTVSNSGLNYLIARSDQLYGWTIHGQSGNTVTKVLEKLRKGEEVYEIIDWYNNPTLVDNAAEVIKTLIEKKKIGIYHVVGSEFLNRVEWAMKIADVFGFDKSLIKSKKSRDINLPAKRPNANLSNEKAQKDSGMKLFNIKEGLEFMHKQVS